MAVCAPAGGRTPHGVRGLKFGNRKYCGIEAGSHPSRGAWVEIPHSRTVSKSASGRTPHGVRGLKSESWCRVGSVSGRRTPHGVRGLKSTWTAHGNATASRTPHGVRGLKFRHSTPPIPLFASHPSRGAWIEIEHVLIRTPAYRTSHPSRGAWIEISNHWSEKYR